MSATKTNLKAHLTSLDQALLPLLTRVLCIICILVPTTWS